MSYPIDSLAAKLFEVDNTMREIKQFATSQSAAMVAGSVTAGQILFIRYRMKTARDQLNILKNTPGLSVYARTEKNNETFDIVADFVAIMTALIAVVTNVETTFPVDGNGYLLRDKFDPSGDLTERLFAPAATLVLSGLLDDVVTLIN